MRLRAHVSVQSTAPDAHDREPHDRCLDEWDLRPLLHHGSPHPCDYLRMDDTADNDSASIQTVAGQSDVTKTLLNYTSKLFDLDVIGEREVLALAEYPLSNPISEEQAAVASDRFIAREGLSKLFMNSNLDPIRIRIWAHDALRARSDIPPLPPFDVELPERERTVMQHILQHFSTTGDWLPYPNIECAFPSDWKADLIALSLAEGPLLQEFGGAVIPTIAGLTIRQNLFQNLLVALHRLLLNYKRSYPNKPPNSRALDLESTLLRKQLHCILRSCTRFVQITSHHHTGTIKHITSKPKLRSYSTLSDLLPQPTSYLPVPVKIPAESQHGPDAPSTDAERRQSLLRTWPGYCELSTSFQGPSGVAALILALITLVPTFAPIKVHFLDLKFSIAGMVFSWYHGFNFFLLMRVWQAASPKAALKYTKEVFDKYNLWHKRYVTSLTPTVYVFIAVTIATQTITQIAGSLPQPIPKILRVTIGVQENELKELSTSQIQKFVNKGQSLFEAHDSILSTHTDLWCFWYRPWSGSQVAWHPRDMKPLCFKNRAECELHVKTHDDYKTRMIAKDMACTLGDHILQQAKEHCSDKTAPHMLDCMEEYRRKASSY